jgi:hypothetical protein
VKEDSKDVVSYGSRCEQSAMRRYLRQVFERVLDTCLPFSDH